MGAGQVSSVNDTVKGISRFRDCDLRLHVENNFAENDVFRAYSRRVPMFDSHGFVRRPGFFVPRENHEPLMFSMGRLSAIRESFLYGVQVGLVSGQLKRMSSLSFANFEPVLVLLGQTLRNTSKTLLALNLDNAYLTNSSAKDLPFMLCEVFPFSCSASRFRFVFLAFLVLILRRGSGEEPADPGGDVLFLFCAGVQAKSLQILRVTYSNFGGRSIAVTLRELGRNARLQEVDFSGYFSLIPFFFRCLFFG